MREGVSNTVYHSGNWRIYDSIFIFYFLFGGNGPCTVTPEHRVWESEQDSPVGLNALWMVCPVKLSHVLPTIFVPLRYAGGPSYYIYIPLREIDRGTRYTVELSQTVLCPHTVAEFSSSIRFSADFHETCSAAFQLFSTKEFF